MEQGNAFLLAGVYALKVLLVSLNRYRNPMPVMPVGACTVADAVAAAGHEVRFLDLMFSRSPMGDLTREVASFSPDVVGLSLRNIDDNNLLEPEEFHGELRRAVDSVRRCSAAPIAAGGAAFAVMPEALLRSSGADLGVVGDGDSVFPEVLGALGNDGQAGNVPGAAEIRDGEFRCNPADGSRLRNGPCVPDYGRWLDLRAYRRAMGTAGVQTKRGCEFQCVYCTYALVEGPRYRFHPVDGMVEGVRKLVRSGIRDIEFVDSVFNAPYEHALAVCEAFARAGTGARLQSLELNPRFVDEPLLSAMGRAGFSGIGITAESVSDPVLAGLGKQYRSDDVHRAAETVSRCSLPCVWIFMFGGPGETPDTVRETLRFAGEKVRPSDVVFMNFGIRIYPGTELERIARDEGVLQVAGVEMLKPVFYLSPQVNREWLAAELDRFLANHPGAVGPRSLALPFLPLVQRIGYRCGVRPPLWKHTRRIRRILSAVGVRT
jgi:radical SAM superfamily enzyme YgiQ (UPF0313 family)